MKMNKPYIEIVRFDAEDVIATSGVVNCTVKSLQTGDILLHRNNQSKEYFVYDYGLKTITPVAELDGNTKLYHKGQETTNTTAYDGTSETGYSAYIYDDGWTWWDEESNASHGNY